MKILLAQMKVRAEKRRNVQTALELIRGAHGKADLAVLPEMFCCPYRTELFPAYAEEEGGETWQAMSLAAKENGMYLVAGSMPERDGVNVYNTAYAFDREGRQIAKHRKIHLFDIEGERGQGIRESDTLAAGGRVTVFDTEFCKIGLAICYDMRFPELSRLMADRGAKLIVAPAVFSMLTGSAHWELLYRMRAVDNQAFTVGVAPARDAGGAYSSYANSIAVSPWGDVLARLGEGEECAVVDVDPAFADEIRARFPLLERRRRDVYRLEQLEA